MATAGSLSLDQRVLLWASTSTKNPEYADLLYVENLIGPDTVNTMRIDLRTMEGLDAPSIKGSTRRRQRWMP